jgi:hypothetical protein
VQGIQAGQQFLGGKRFRQVIISPGGKAAHAVSHTGARREDEHGREYAVLAQIFHDGKTIHVRQSNVQDGGITLVTLEPGQGWLAEFLPMQFMPCLSHPHGHLTAELRIIFDKKEFHESAVYGVSVPGENSKLQTLCWPILVPPLVKGRLTSTPHQVFKPS